MISIKNQGHFDSTRSLRIWLMLCITPVLVLQACTAPSPNQHASNSEGYSGPGLAMQMHHLQTWTHKLALSIEAENEQLVDFYHHEAEEAIEDIIGTVPEYDGYPIASLMQSMLVPSMDSLEQALETADWRLIRTRFEQVIVSCNQCHMATDHGFIVIDTGFGKNPFNQIFQIK